VTSARIKHVDVEVTAGYHVLPTQHHGFNVITNIIDGLR